MIDAVYLDGVLIRSITAFIPEHLLEYMIIELFGHIEQLPEKLTCLTMLKGKKSVGRVEPKRLMEKPPMQSPSIAVRQ